MTAQRVTFASVGFSREAQRTRSSSSSAAAAGGHTHVEDDDLDCLHLPSDTGEADWLCIDFARARRELRRMVESGGKEGGKGAGKQQPRHNVAARIWSLIEERVGKKGREGDEEETGKRSKPSGPTRGFGFTVRRPPRTRGGGGEEEEG